MSNFLLPKNNIINKQIRFSLDDDISSINISIIRYYSNYYNEINKLLLEKSNTCFYNYENIIKIINPYESIFSTIPGTKNSVSKLKTKSLLFYDLIEINNSLDLFGSFGSGFYKNKNLDILNISPKNEDFSYYLEMMIENKVNTISYSKLSIENFKLINNKYDFIYFEEIINPDTDVKSYINTLIKALFLIFNYQCDEGSCLIKIDNIFYKPVIELLYLFSSFFEKVYIIKPTTTNMATSEKYIVCKNFISKNVVKINETTSIEKILNEYSNYLSTHDNQVITSILDKEIPYYFLNKIHDLNSILVQQQLETMEQLMNLLKSKNKEDKIELLKKNNIQKSVLWCEKFKIPYNKFTEKTNIFLNIVKENLEESESYLENKEE